MISLTSLQASAFVSDACRQIENSHDDAWNDITTAGLSRAQYEAQFVARLCAGAANIAIGRRSHVLPPRRCFDVWIDSTGYDAGQFFRVVQPSVGHGRSPWQYCNEIPHFGWSVSGRVSS